MPELEPKIGVINTFKTQKTEVQFALGEFVDNSIDSYFKYKDDLEKENKDFKPYIDITFDSDSNSITVEDNCAGIHKKDEERAFNIGITNPNQSDIGTYGMGMKVSAFWFASKWEVITKSIFEKEEKTFKVDLDKILETGKTEDSKKISNADSGTKITLFDVYEGRLPKESQKLMNIQKYLFQMYRFMIMDQKITIKFNGSPLRQEFPVIFKKRYIDEKNGEEKEWLTALPKFNLGTVTRKGIKVKLSTLGGAAYIKEKGSSKGQFGFAIFWKNRLVDGHPQKPWMPSSLEYGRGNKLAIYGARNQYVAQRLEGYIHLSPDFTVPSTKDGVDWAGLEEDLIVKLREYLENAILLSEKENDSPKRYDFIKQANNISDLNKDDNEDESPDETGLNGEEDEETPIFIPNPEPDSDPELDNGEDAIFSDPDLEEISVKFDETVWKVKIEVSRKSGNKFYQVVDGPHGQSGDKERTIGLKINLSHSYIRMHFYQSDLPEQKQGILRFCLALALAEAIAAEKTGNRAQFVRKIFLQILDTFSEES